MVDVNMDMLRMSTCAVLRQSPAWALVTDERSRAAVEVAERYARGEATDDEMTSASAAAWAAVRWHSHLAQNMLGCTENAKCRAVAIAAAHRAASAAAGSRFNYQQASADRAAFYAAQANRFMALVQ